MTLLGVLKFTVLLTQIGNDVMEWDRMDKQSILSYVLPQSLASAYSQLLHHLN